MGDIHGAVRALKQVLVRANFDKENDRLIFLGDVADGWPDVKACIDELLTIKNLVHMLGNHDEWMLDAANGDHPGSLWIEQGGRATINSYAGIENVPESHKAFLSSAKLYHEEDGRMFLHAGWPVHEGKHPLAYTNRRVLNWDRTLIQTAIKYKGRKDSITQFDEVYIGHTPTPFFKSYDPINACEVWNMDTGAGYGYKLSMMNIDTKEVFQSDNVQELYPGVKGR